MRGLELMLVFGIGIGVGVGVGAVTVLLLTGITAGEDAGCGMFLLAWSESFSVPWCVRVCALERVRIPCSECVYF